MAAAGRMRRRETLATARRRLAGAVGAAARMVWRRDDLTDKDQVVLDLLCEALVRVGELVRPRSVDLGDAPGHVHQLLGRLAVLAQRPAKKEWGKVTPAGTNHESAEAHITPVEGTLELAYDEFDWRDFDWYFGKDGPIVEAPTMRHSAGSANEGRPDPSPEKDKGKGNQVSTTKARIDEWLATEFGHRAEVNDAEGEQTLASDDELVSLRSSEPEALPLNMSELVDFRVVDRRVPVRVAPFSDAILRFCCAGATVQGIVYQVERHYEYSHWLKLHDGWIPIDGSGFRKLLEPIASDSSSAVTSETSRSSTPRAATSTSTRRRSDVFHEAGT